MKTYWGVEFYLHAFLTSALDGGEWSGSFFGHFMPGGDLFSRGKYNFEIFSSHTSVWGR
jgi:hypothetical protein